MPQMLRQDNIPRMLVASTTTATLATTSGGNTTSVTIGGQSYQPASLLTLNAATVGANGLDAGSLGASQLWYVYAIAHQTSFAMALVASLSAAPTMPTGYGTAYKLIGAFNTNASSQISFTVVPEDGVVYPVVAGSVLGRTDGTAVPAGYIGETITSSLSTTYTVTTTIADVPGLSVTLTSGVWIITMNVGFYCSLAQSSAWLVSGASTGVAAMGAYLLTSGSAEMQNMQSLTVPVSISATTTYKIQAIKVGTLALIFSDSVAYPGISYGKSKLTAVRIA